MITPEQILELAEELYEILKELRDVINLFQVPPVLDSKIDRINNFLHKYEEATNRGTGRTTILYHKAITEALENPGKSVEFVDHIPHNWDSAKQHENNLATIIIKLGYNIVVSTKGQAQVYLYNKFGQ
jgi:hypothetical protein